MTVTLTFLLVLGLVFQVAAATPAIIGDVGRQLSEQEIAEIARVVSTNAFKPWLFALQRGQIGGVFVYVYHAPTIDTPDIRRGTRTLLSRVVPSSKGVLQKWKVNGSGWYAQVAIPGRDFALINGEQDLNQPFGVGAKFSNEDLVSIAKLIRSSPLSTAPSRGSDRVEGIWPIDSVERDQKGIVAVQTRKNISSGQVVKLTKTGEQWSISGIGFWIR